MQTEIRDFILRDASNEDLNEIIEYVKLRRQSLSRQNTMTLRRGANVQFTSSRSGQVIRGVVEDIKIKNVIVSTPLGRYKVPANMIEAV